MRPLALFAPLALWASKTFAEVTIYTTIPGLNGPVSSATTAPIPLSTGNSAYNSVILTPPAVPAGLNTTVAITLNASGGMPGLSVNQKGSYLGFSVELSVASQILGTNSSFLNPIFLNYLANIKERAGQGPIVRVGGNSQDESTMYPQTFIDQWGHPQMIQKWRVANSNPTDTPNINFAVELFYAMGNISKLVDVDWYFGLAFDNPYNDSNALEVAQTIESILGDHLIALQLGNEPDLYASHLRRPENYSIPDYFTEFQYVITGLQGESLPREKIIMGPSVCCDWTTDSVLQAGYLSTFASALSVLSIMHYPNNNCAIGGQINPQDVFPTYLTHQAAQAFVAAYTNSTPEALAAGLPVVLLETNTASCGGFPGVSDSFGATLWAIDNALALAAANFTTMLLHVGGQSDSYNPFTPPPTNLSTTQQWTTGSVYYANLAVAETFGSSNVSQIVDLQLPNQYQVGYAIYENGAPTRLAFVNFVSDPSGASTFNAIVSFNGGAVPSTVSVRYALAPSVSEKFNITWAGQTMGSTYMDSDGRLKGEQQTTTINCDTTANTCSIPVPAPGFALVFLTEQALQNSSPSQSDSSLTFATTAVTNVNQVPLIAPAELLTMNGEGGPGPRYTGSVSKGQNNNNVLIGAAPSRLSISPIVWSLVGAVLGAMIVMHGRN